jgi:predicted CoA-substrate-specific enzyme activase
MRMNDNALRQTLYEDPHLKAISYHMIQFCDFYGFEYAQLPEGIPALKIETDYTPASSGQLMTRLQAFFENNGLLVSNVERRKMSDGNSGGQYFAGVDCGSTSTNAVIIDAAGSIAASVTLPTGAKSSDAAGQALAEAIGKLGAVHNGADCIREPEEIVQIVATGYGRASVPFPAMDVTEITCHARGAHALAPGVRTIIDIGGQDSKVIRLDASGNVTEFSMNDKCAAGTGRFLELMAGTLGMALDEMASAGLRPNEQVDISSMCAVFAESEVISLIASGKKAEDIIWGVDLAIAGRVASMAARLGSESPYIMTGGVAKNAGVVKALGAKLAAQAGGRAKPGLTVPDDPRSCGAFGAALIARDGARR